MSVASDHFHPDSWCILQSRFPRRRRYTSNTEAYQLYLQGRYYLNKDSLEEINKAIKYFDQAIAKDPDYALAYAGLADSYIELAQPWVAGLPPQEALQEAKAATTKALRIDDTLGEAHSSLAHVIELYDWDWSGSEREYKRGIELNPNFAMAHQWYAEYLSALGREGEAIAEAKRAIELDPLNNSVNAALGYFFYFAHRYDQAIEQFNKTGDHWGLGWAYEEKGMYEEAITELQTSLKVTGRHDFSVASLGYTYGVFGKKGEARKLLEELMKRAEQRYVSPYSTAYIYTSLGEMDRAYECLGEGYKSHDPWMIWLKVDPKLDSLRSDPRFTDLVRRVGL
jgi:tetratricopeptide (TPR) repeat protein